ncbi:hypothetical protein [Meridianimaribacter flavus]|uniref:HNH endonuclease n=1 Tax=Meridianimaribacter flavus TaxID=571115 RepID=A0ABY2G8L7_9FLAO|nr:hypothetical protein [Meridianimaribacter flavus]TDY14152.1 hypothetical protein A8975_0754 [Meridianimaribacter flavus]
MININNRSAKKAKIIHLNNLRAKVLKSKHLNSLPNYILKFIKANLDELLSANPLELTELNKKYYSIQKSSNKRKYDSIIKKVFSYKNFSKDKKEYNLNDLSNNISIKYCPYCNRQSTINVRANLIKPDFDHYFPQSRYPILGLSFHNLIPSCTVCNSRFKLNKPLRLKFYPHPYMDNIIEDFNFSYKYDINSKNTISIILNKNNPIPPKVIRHLKLFKILETYNAHNDEIFDLIKLKQIYSDRYLHILSSQTYTGLKVSQKELYRLAFGVFYDSEDFGSRPFSKLKKDILEELNII